MIPVVIIGLISSIVTELLKLFPALGKTKSEKRILAFVVTFILCFGYLASQSNPDWSVDGVLSLLAGSMASSFAVYKSIIQTLVKPKNERA